MTASGDFQPPQFGVYLIVFLYTAYAVTVLSLFMIGWVLSCGGKEHLAVMHTEKNPNY